MQDIKREIISLKCIQNEPASLKLRAVDEKSLFLCKKTGQEGF